MRQVGRRRADLKFGKSRGLGRALAESRTSHASQALYESGGPWRCRLEPK